MEVSGPSETTLHGMNGTPSVMLHMKLPYSDSDPSSIKIRIVYSDCILFCMALLTGSAGD